MGIRLTNKTDVGVFNIECLIFALFTDYNYQGVVSNQQQSYQQTIPNQSFMNQPQTNTNMAPGYQMGNMQMHNRGMNQPSGYGMSAGMQVPNQSNMMGGHQPPRYSGIMNQQTRTMNR